MFNLVRVSGCGCPGLIRWRLPILIAEWSNGAESPGPGCLRGLGSRCCPLHGSFEVAFVEETVATFFWRGSSRIRNRKKALIGRTAGNLDICFLGEA